MATCTRFPPGNKRSKLLKRGRGRRVGRRSQNTDVIVQVCLFHTTGQQPIGKHKASKKTTETISLASLHRDLTPVKKEFFNYYYYFSSKIYVFMTTS